MASWSLVAGAPTVRAQPALGARILDVVYVGKIYDGDTEPLNFTVMNLGRKDASGDSLFFFKILADNALLVNEFSSPWECKPGVRVSRAITIAGLVGPDDYTVRAELYWKNQTTQVLEDAREFRVLVVRLYATGWSQSISTIQLGAKVASTLVVSFENGGNDKMFSATISIKDSSDIRVDPQSRSIGDVDAGEIARAEFSVSAPQTTSMGSHVLTFEILYLDFRGTPQEETVSATLTVTKLGSILEIDVAGSLKYSYPIMISARLQDANGDPITDQTIRFHIISGTDQRDIGSNLTDSSGIARLVYYGVLNSGDYELKASYEGSASHDATTTAIRVTILPSATKLTPTVPGSSVVGQTVSISVQLTDESGKPISGQVVEFYADSEKFGSAPTDENGLVSALFVPGRKGSVQLRITYEGSGNFASAEWSGVLPIEAIQTKLTLFVSGFALQGDNLVFLATIKDSAGIPIQSAALAFVVVAGSTRLEQTLMTDSHGSASLSFKVARADNIRVDVVYAGDLKYEASEATAHVTVFSPLLLGGLLAIVIGAAIVGVFGFMKFKLGISPLTRIRGRPPRPLQQTKTVVPPAITGRVEHCAKCGASLSETDTICRACGSRREAAPLASDLDEKVYSYIVEHSGVISLRQAASDLGITPEQVRQSAERLKQSGRLG